MLAGIACPISLLEEYAAQGHYHMALSHLILESKQYRDFYLRMSERGDFVSVDNGVVEEGEALPIQKVLEAAHAVHAKEVVLPDVLHDSHGTLIKTALALDYLRSHRCLDDLQWMGVPHGRTFREWLSCYLTMLDLPDIGTIGVSMFDHDLLPGCRPQILSALEQLNLIDYAKEYHVLGCWSDLREVWFLAHRCEESPTRYGRYHGCHSVKRSWVRSMDTGVPVRLGLLHYRHATMEDPEVLPAFKHRKEDFYAKHVINETIQYNIDLYKQWCEE